MLPPNLHPQSRGFTLVEVMVGMVIALLATIVMLNVFSVFEAQKRTTTGGSDVQNNGAITLFDLQHTIEKAGYGLTNKDMLGCSLKLNATVTLPAIAPVIINPPTSVIPAGDANTDTILVMYGDSPQQPEGDIINSAGPPGADPVNVYTVRTPTSFSLNDQVIALPTARPSPCNLVVDSVVGTSSTTVSVQQGTAVATMPNLPANATSGTGILYNLGNTTIGNMLKVWAYAVRGSNLTVCDYTANNCGDPSKTNTATVWLPIGSDIVSMRAVYGRDTTIPMDGTVDTYDQSTPLSTSATYACDWARISAVRMVLVGRNNQPNHQQVTGANSLTWSSNAVAAINVSATNSLLPPGFTWQNYRYKAFESTAAIRNIAMKGAVSGC